MHTADLHDQHLHIIGLGLMGGSLALDLQSQVGRLTAEDRNPQVIEEALQRGLIAASDERDQADIVVLAIPVHHMPGLIANLPGTLQAGTLVIDLGSTKAAVCAALDALPDDLLAVGGHPMCGLAENSFRNATAGLYQDARFVLCETARTTDRARLLAEALVTASGATPLWLERHRHDFLTAVTSHLPHLLNFALMQLAVDVEGQDGDLYALAAGGFDGATRLARTNTAMITGMFSTNADNLRQLTDQFIQQLEALAALLDDPEQLEPAIEDIVQARRRYSEDYGERPIS